MLVFSGKMDPLGVGVREGPFSFTCWVGGNGAVVLGLEDLGEWMEQRILNVEGSGLLGTIGGRMCGAPVGSCQTLRNPGTSQ